MRKISIIVLILASITACRNKEYKSQSTDETVALTKAPDTRYPEALHKIFKAHGGLDNWRSMRSLEYEMPGSDQDEIHIINLYSRKDRVNTPSYSMGFDGEEVWLLDEKGGYEGDAVFYHNLMFYFFAMPFVIADDGIVYTETEDLVYEGKNYPGYRISYNAGVGTSPKDEYFIHYDPKTYQMKWLGYTVTYRTGEKSEHVKWIRYGSWQEVEGVVLPEKISWYTYEGRTLMEPKSSVSFRNVILSKDPQPDEVFEKPEKAKSVQARIPT
jgi:hypothetical protein